METVSPPPPRPALAALLLLPCCGAGEDRPQDPAALVREERMVRTVRELVDLGPRAGGTASGRAAAELRRAAFEAAGLEARVLEDPETWAWQAREWSVACESSSPAGGTEPLALARAHPLGSSPASAGRGALSLAPAEGGVLLAERPPDPPAQGVLACLADGAVSGDGGWPVLFDLPGPRPHPYPVFALSRPEGERLRRALAAGARVEVAFALDAELRRARPRTVEARLPAEPGAPPGFLLFCAHGDSDSGGPGANDNASGEAIVLELARAWADAVSSGILAPPQREVRFAIWGKEIHSSRAYLERLRAGELGPVLGMVNFDQSGFGSGADRLYVEPDDLPANVALVRTFADLLAERAGSPGFPAQWATVPSLGGTDSYVFSGSALFRDAGLPAVTVYASAWGETEQHPRTPGMPGESWSDRDLVEVDHDDFYHSAGDLPRHTTDREPWNMGWCARAAWLAALRYLEGL